MKDRGRKGRGTCRGGLSGRGLMTMAMASNACVRCKHESMPLLEEADLVDVDFGNNH